MSAKILFVIAWAASLGSATLAQPLSSTSVRQDLAYLRDVWAPKERSYSPAARQRMVAFVDEEISRARPMERTDLALIFAEAQAMSGNDHTQTNYLREDNLFHALPISFWMFPEGAVITRAHPQFRDLLGAKIRQIGGVSVPEAEQLVAKYISGTPERHRYLAPAWLAQMEVLEALGLAHDGVAALELQLADGRVVTQKLSVAPSSDPAAESPPWRQSLVPGKGPNPWPHVLDKLPDLPLFARPPDELAATSLDDGRVLYIRSTSLSPYTDDPNLIETKAYTIIDNVFKKGRAPSDVIVDLRFNDGGNFFNIINFSTELGGLVGPAGHIWVITGRTTNSAAIVFTALLKAATHGRTTIVGEEPSDNPWFWSEGETLQAPASKLPLHYTNGYHDWAHGCRDWSKCYWPAIFHGVAVQSVSPDNPIEMTFADYAAGRDRTLESILSKTRGRSRRGR